ncbi:MULTISPECIES: hypothetical protein [unclassified Lysinibacillus]|uniref:hypothetical protein n=1 Tax=unclassified Lysinibacillus TaxID=2636778 RepID=UPI003826BC09
MMLSAVLEIVISDFFDVISDSWHFISGFLDVISDSQHFISGFLDVISDSWHFISDTETTPSFCRRALLYLV